MTARALWLLLALAAGALAGEEPDRPAPVLVPDVPPNVAPRDGAPPAGGRLQRDGHAAGHLSAEGMRVRYTFDARAGELSLFDVGTWGYARGWSALAAAAVLGPGGAPLLVQKRPSGTSGRLFVAWEAPADGEYAFELAALEQTFRYTVVRHSGYRVRGDESLPLQPGGLTHGYLGEPGDVARWTLPVQAGRAFVVRVRPTHPQAQALARATRATAPLRVVEPDTAAADAAPGAGAPPAGRAQDPAETEGARAGRAADDTTRGGATEGGMAGAMEGATAGAAPARGREDAAPARGREDAAEGARGGASRQPPGSGGAAARRAGTRGPSEALFPRLVLDVTDGDGVPLGQGVHSFFEVPERDGTRALTVRIAEGAIGALYEVIVEDDLPLLAVSGYVGDRDDEPVPGVVIHLVREPEFDHVATVVSASDGTWTARAPAGRYTVLQRTATGGVETLHVVLAPDAPNEVNTIVVE